MYVLFAAGAVLLRVSGSVPHRTMLSATSSPVVHITFMVPESPVNEMCLHAWNVWMERMDGMYGRNVWMYRV